MITEIKLQSNNGESTARFWSAIFGVPAVQLSDGSWRITPANGPGVVVSTARVVETISRYVDLTVTVDSGAADRLRALGFEVAHDGRQAVDTNGTDDLVPGADSVTLTGPAPSPRSRSAAHSRARSG